MKLLRTFLTAAMVGLFALPAAADIYNWDQTPSANTNSDIGDDVNWVEGMAPSEVNNSARAMMSEIRKWIDDQGASTTSSGLLTTAGSANAQTLTTNGTAPSLTHGHRVCFIAGATNTAAMTLNVDSFGAVAVQQKNGTALQGGEIALNQLYCVVYDAADNVWMIFNQREIDYNSLEYTTAGVMRRAALTGDVAAPTGSNVTTIQPQAVEASMLQTSSVHTVPVGAIFMWGVNNSCPAKTLQAGGDEVSRTTYSELFGVIGTTFGAGDGSTTFNVPDIRDRVVVGDATMGGLGDAARISNYTTSGPNNTGGQDDVVLVLANSPAHTHTWGATSGSNSASHTHYVSGTSGTVSAWHTHYTTVNSTGSHNHSYTRYSSQSNNLQGASSTVHDNIWRSTTSSNTGSSGTHNHGGTSGNPSANHTHSFADTSNNQSANHTHYTSGTTSSSGSGTAHDNMPPFIVLTYCIYSGV